jgi:hypothetical protein
MITARGKRSAMTPPSGLTAMPAVMFAGSTIAMPLAPRRPGQGRPIPGGEAIQLTWSRYDWSLSAQPSTKTRESKK